MFVLFYVISAAVVYILFWSAETIVSWIWP